MSGRRRRSSPPPSEDPNNLTVVSGWATIEAARAFTSNPDLTGAMDEAGVTSAPRFELYEEVEAVEY